MHSAPARYVLRPYLHCSGRPGARGVHVGALVMLFEAVHGHPETAVEARRIGHETDVIRFDTAFFRGRLRECITAFSALRFPGVRSLRTHDHGHRHVFRDPIEPSGFERDARFSQLLANVGEIWKLTFDFARIGDRGKLKAVQRSLLSRKYAGSSIRAPAGWACGRSAACR